ncbi:MAG TPA: glycoside hydrolase family 2 TIM barrel-domain containing protein [Candidatus Sulfotelmatobacter sp.]|nr:glycoside hydrolase family 2 TIM barrel-domain containing protein [Candidatus Sulfotelmatobacter sp.]
MIQSPADWPGEWSLVGRTHFQAESNSATIEGGYAVCDQKLDDAEISFQARTPVGVEQVQIWAGFRFRDRDSRYVFALRGGNDNDLYLARYAPDGGMEFLGIAPLDFKPVPGIWYGLRVVILGNRIQIFLNDEKLPRLNIKDRHPLWNTGSILLGGGWLPAEFSGLRVKALDEQDKKACRAIGDEHWLPPAADKESLRKQARSEYSPGTIPSPTSPREEVSLDGNWLFMPDYQLSAGELPVQSDYDDQAWHVMQVPSFWTPALSWLHGEKGFPDLDEFSKTKGVAESLYVQRIKKCDSYTFDWRKTDAAWYRHYLDFPADIGDRHFELTFNAIAKVSKVWVNGIEVGGHTGMFGPVKCDITKAIRPGRNMVVVHVIGRPASENQAADKVESVAVTVEVTSSMLHSLPHGMFQEDTAGIWQPVTLVETAPVHVSDCFVNPGLHGAHMDFEIANNGSQPATARLDYSISSVPNGEILCSNSVSSEINVEAATTHHLKLTTPLVNPKLWSPAEPNLYNLETTLSVGNKVVDVYHTRFGFRTFTVDGSRFLLNGRPFWLRGANPFPNTLMPNDGELARDFMRKAREGNVSVTRSHIVPFTTTWLDAADETGMGVSFEGTWPWLMLEGEPPDKELINIWRDEFISLMREYRNHPSILLWTVNNEMKFEQFDEDNPERLKNKWGILDETIKAMRATDPTRPVVPDSSYVRQETQKGYESVVKPKNLDDGDVDDLHRYFGWYNESFFHYYDGQLNKYNTPGRPLISQEMSTGYPNNDDGHPARFYLFKHYTPQALVGDDAYENADPAIFLNRQAFMTKELAETLRRTSHESAAGILYFSYFTWFQSPWSASRMKPWPAYYALQSALQPVLASAELFDRHFYSDTNFHARVCIVNDSETYQAIPSGSHLIWEFQYDGQVLSQGKVEAPEVNYYENGWLDVDFKTPRNLPAPRTDGQLVLKLESAGKIISENRYDVVIATPDWSRGEPATAATLSLWNPGKHPVDGLSGLAVTGVDSVAAVNPESLLIVGNLNQIQLSPAEMEQLTNFVCRGGSVLMLHPGMALPELFPEQVKLFRARAGEIVTMHMPESPVFSGIEPLDTAWFDRGGRNLPAACAGVYEIVSGRADISALADQCDFHGYLKTPSEITKYSGAPLVELQIGKGRLIASELNLEAGRSDPIARRLLMNLIHYLQP